LAFKPTTERKISNCAKSQLQTFLRNYKMLLRILTDSCQLDSFTYAMQVHPNVSVADYHVFKNLFAVCR